MLRFALLALLIACGNGSKSPGDQQKSPGTEGGGEKVVVPGAKGGAAEGDRGGPTIGSADGTGTATTGAPPTADDPTKLTDATKQRAQNPMFHLKPEEGTLTVAKAEAKAGTPTSAEIKLAPGKGYHVATDYPIKIWLEAPTGVKLEKTFLTAGGRNKVQGDAATLSEQSLAFAVKATADKAGTHEIQGVFSFGICENEACHPRTQPIKIQVAAN